MFWGQNRGQFNIVIYIIYNRYNYNINIYNYNKVYITNILDRDILDIIEYASNIFNKYNIEKKINFFNISNCLYKDYIWIEKSSDFTIKYIICDLSILLNYLLQRLMKNHIVCEKNNDILLQI